MKVGIFYNGSETIVLGLDKDDVPMNAGGLIFGPDSGRNLENYDCKSIDVRCGEVAIISHQPDVSVVQ